MYIFFFLSFPVADMQIPIGQNRKRGRPGETTTALEKQPDEEVSSISGESSTDSTAELLKRIDLNADNSEDDTLVDASALNETANEPIIQMVVPANIVGYAIRGGGGSRGGRSSRGGRGRGAGVLNEGEISTLRRSKRNAQNSS